MKVFLNIAEKSLFYLGFCLFVINASGLFISLRNESIYQEPTGFVDDITLSEQEFYHRIKKTIIDKKNILPI